MSKAIDPSTQNEATKKTVTEDSKDVKSKKKVGFKGGKDSIDSLNQGSNKDNMTLDE